MDKLESAKIIYKQDGYCKQKSAGGLAVPCDDCFLYPEYCDKRGIANVKSRELAKQYIAEEKPKAKPEHKPCDWDDGWEPEKPEHKMCQNCGHKYVGDKCSRCWHDNMTGMADKSCKKPEHKLYQDGDKNIPEIILDRNGQVALGMCKICGKAESELSEACEAKPEHKPCPRCKGTELQALCNFINCCTCGINNNNGKIKSSNEAWDDWDRDFDMEG